MEWKSMCYLRLVSDIPACKFRILGVKDRRKGKSYLPFLFSVCFLLVHHSQPPKGQGLRSSFFIIFTYLSIFHITENFVSSWKNSYRTHRGPSSYKDQDKEHSRTYRQVLLGLSWRIVLFIASTTSRNALYQHSSDIWQEERKIEQETCWT